MAFKHLAVLAALCAAQLIAQTNVYLRAGGPPAVLITGATNATPIVLTTFSAHGFSSSCNTTTNICYCGPTGVPTGLGPSPANGARECVYVDSTHLALYDTSGNPIAGNGNWWPGYNPTPGGSLAGQWVSALTKYTIPANPGPLGFLDGTNGDLMRRVATGTYNGLTSLVVSGCPSACVITIATSYNPLTMTFPVAAGQKFSICGTGITTLDSGSGVCLNGTASPYTVGSASSSGWASTTFTASISNGDYTNTNLHCGPAGTPNDTIGGTQSCTRVSQMAYTGNSTWDSIVSIMTSKGMTSSPSYKTTYDGGGMSPAFDVAVYYAMAALRFLVDPANHLWLDEITYAINHDDRSNGVGYGYNSAAVVYQSNSMFNYTTEIGALSLIYPIAAPYMPSSERTAFLDRQFNDSDDPSGTACTTTNQDAANQSTHNWVLSRGLLAAGTNDSFHAQLPVTDSHYSTVDYYKNTVIKLDNNQGGNDYAHATYGLITGQTSAGVLTVSGWFDGNGGGGVAPALNTLVGGTYTGGLTCTGSTGQLAGIQVANNGYFSVPLTSTNTIASGTALKMTGPGSGYVSAPTTGTFSQGISTAICSGTPVISTTIGTPYAIFDTITTSSSANGATATITFTKTASLSGSINVGDGIMGFNGWGSNFTLGANLSYVSVVGSNTLTGINGPTVRATSTPSIAWRLPQWTTGDCGRLRASKAQTSNSYGVQPIVYGPGATGLSVNLSTGFLTESLFNGGGASTPMWPAFELAVATDEPRAVRDLVRTQGALFDLGVRPLIEFSSGRLFDGAGYSLDQDTPSGDLSVWTWTNSIPTYPKLDVTGPWAQNVAQWDMFETMPDRQGGNPNLMMWAGSGGWYGLGPVDVTSIGLAFQSSAEFAPSSNTAAWFRNWQEHIGPSNLWGLTESSLMAFSFLHNDPRVPSSDYTVQPPQFAFTQASDVSGLTGAPTRYHGDSVISRTGWSSVNDSVLLFDASTWVGSNVYDSPRVGQVALYATGQLLGGDSNPSNGIWGSDTSTIGDTFQFNASGFSGFKSGATNVGRTPITRWAAANAGPYGMQYGDSAGRYIGACTDEAPIYNQAALSLSIDHAQRCVAEAKASGKDHFIFQLDDVSLTGGTAAMAWHLHYPQNGTAQTGPAGPLCGSPCTSSTTLSGGVITSLEDGGGSPARTHGLMTYVTSPGTITLRDDCVGHGNGQCAPGNTYPGGNGYTHRFTIAGGSSVGAPVSQFASVVVHKVMSNLSDTTLTTVNLNPDANWTGVQACGAVSCAVFLGARKGKTYSAIASFTTTHSGTAQYLVTGLTPGSYNVTVGGSPVLTGATVSAGDNSLYFEATAGAVSLSQTGIAPSIATVSLPASTAGIAYSQALAAVGGATPYTWSVSAGSLPHNLTLNSSTGVIGGTPDTASSSNFTVTVTGADTLSASAPLSIVINPALLVTTATLPGATLAASYSQTLAASGGTGAHTWSIAAGALPGGLHLDSNTGTISGTPTAAGSFTFTVLATDSLGAIASKAFSITAQRPAGTTVHGTTMRGVTAH